MTESIPVAEQMLQAINNHDLEAFVALFAPDYQSEQPLAPGRMYQGRDQVRANWERIFADIPDLQATLLRLAVAGNTEWCEWHWVGHMANDEPFDVRGVVIQGIEAGRIAWARLYMQRFQPPG